MSQSNYPKGFSSITVRGIPLAQTHPGKVFWVSNAAAAQLTGQKTGSDGNKGTFDAPFATLDFAVGQCTAGRGDTIFVKPGHAEAISAAAGIALDVAGIAVVGLGTGDSRPTFTLNTANTATITVAAADISVQNCKFVANFLSIATCFAVSTAKNFTVQNCRFQDTGATTNFLNCIKTTGAANTADGLTVTGSQWFGLGTTSVNSFILSADAIAGATLLDNVVCLNRTATAAALLTVTTGVLINFVAGRNLTYTAQTATTAGGLINVGGTTSTGTVFQNYMQTLATATDILFTTTVGLGAFENRVSGAVGATGFVIPAVDT